MPKEFIANNLDEFHAVAGHAVDHFDSSDKPLKFTVTEHNGTGKTGMLRLWRKWMAITADYMSANGSKMPLMTRSDGSWYGSRPFNSDDAHALFTSQWLGLNEKGERLSWVMSDGENVADTGQRFRAMLQHEDWCLEKGIKLPQPRNSELHELKGKQNGISEK